uniref:Peptidase M12B domain-containing protein n=1 Tax=Biomphalaria glabrata TaxID=6526 RepID=A0A2C9KXJ4_BIOGL
VDLQHGASGHSTVGLANAGGVCNAGSRCAYVEDTGIDTGLTLAHEIGHTLGASTFINTFYIIHFDQHGIISIPEDDHDLVIKPVKEHHSSRARRSAGDNPHVVFKRSDQSKACEGVADIEDAILRGAQQKSAGGISVHSAKKRSADELFLELLLVADKTLYHAHGADLHNFLLAITNVAAARFMDPSLGQTLHLSVVKIKILQDDQPDLEIVEEARYGLKSFCEWQERDNPALDSDPLHYDVAVLFTRYVNVFIGGFLKDLHVLRFSCQLEGCVAEKFFNGTKQMIPCLVANPGTDKSDSDCFYTGYSRSHNQSTVAISTCAGL